MKKIIFALLVIIVSSPLLAQKKAVTDDGREVLLHEDGTWEYANAVNDTTVVIPVNPTQYTKAASATFLAKSSLVDFGVYIDPKKWTFKRNTNEGIKEYSFQSKVKDVYVMLTSERIEVPLEEFPDLALKLMKSSDASAKLISKEYRTVNGNKVLCLQMSATASGITFRYLGYYISNESGTVRLIGFTSEKLFKDYKADIEQLLNGLTTIQR